VADQEPDGLAALGLSGAPPTNDPLRSRHLVVLSVGLALTLASAALVLLVALPAVAGVIADILEFLTRQLTRT